RFDSGRRLQERSWSRAPAKVLDARGHRPHASLWPIEGGPEMVKRLSGVAGLVFVVLAVVSIAVRGSVPGTDKRDAPAKFARFYADSSHNSHALLAGVLGLIGLFFFAWFLGGLWSVLRDAEGTTSTPTILVAVGGEAFFALASMSHVIANTVGISLHFDKGYRLDTG